MPRPADPLRLRPAAMTLGLMALIVSPAVADPMYHFTDLGPLIPRAINASGRVVGRSDDGVFLYHGGPGPDAGRVEYLGERNDPFQATSINDAGQIVTNGFHTAIHDTGHVTELDGLGSDNIYANDINAAGQVVGGSRISYDVSHPFLYSGGELVDLGVADPMTSAVAHAINDRGQVVGTASSPKGGDRAFLYSGGRTTDLGTLGGRYSTASDINASGQVVGGSETAGEVLTHAYLHDGQMHDLGTLGGRHSQASGINASGQVVGSSSTPEEVTPHAFLYSGGTMLDLNSLVPPDTGWTLAIAEDINDSGQIVGFGWAGLNTGIYRGFLLTPVPPVATPEPTTLALLAGVAAVAGVRRPGRRRAAQG